jgi:hypothetical protein
MTSNQALRSLACGNRCLFTAEGHGVKEGKVQQIDSSIIPGFLTINDFFALARYRGHRYAGGRRTGVFENSTEI